MRDQLSSKSETTCFLTPTHMHACTHVIIYKPLYISNYQPPAERSSVLGSSLCIACFIFAWNLVLWASSPGLWIHFLTQVHCDSRFKFLILHHVPANLALTHISTFHPASITQSTLTLTPDSSRMPSSATCYY